MICLPAVLDAARHQFKMSVPDQLCVAGFDDVEQAASWASYDPRPSRNRLRWLRALPAFLAAPAGTVDAGEVPTLKLHAELVWRGSIRGGVMQCAVSASRQ